MSFTYDDAIAIIREMKNDPPSEETYHGSERWIFSCCSGDWKTGHKITCAWTRAKRILEAYDEENKPASL